MTILTQSQGDISAAIGLLMKRRGNTTDPEEVTALNAAIQELNDDLLELDAAQLDAAAATVSAAADALERVVASAKTGPFDSFLSEIGGAIQDLRAQQARFHEARRLPSAANEAMAPAAAEAAAPGAPARPGAVDLSFDALKASYQARFDACATLPERVQAVAADLERLQKGHDLYVKAGDLLGIPWFFIGILHGMESGFNFGTHLHNGDPLTARTVHVPAGRPTVGTPPFTWLESAQDALIMQGFQGQADWSITRMLHRFERYNGMGYQRRGLPSPYLWSFSNQYRAGKFVKDGVFDPDAVSQQCGAATLLKALSVRGGLA